jgi:hypothetical protein
MKGTGGIGSGIDQIDRMQNRNPAGARGSRSEAQLAATHTFQQDLSDAKRLKQLEDENAKLKRLVADVMLDNVVLKDLLGKP